MLRHLAYGVLTVQMPDEYLQSRTGIAFREANSQEIHLLKVSLRKCPTASDDLHTAGRTFSSNRVRLIDPSPEPPKANEP
jgi:hypothetical protein